MSLVSEILRGAPIWVAWAMFTLTLMLDISDNLGRGLFLIYFLPLYLVASTKRVSLEERYRLARSFRLACLAAVWIAVLGRFLMGIPIGPLGVLVARRGLFMICLELYYFVLLSGIRSASEIQELEKTIQVITQKFEKLELDYKTTSDKLAALINRFGSHLGAGGT